MTELTIEQKRVLGALKGVKDPELNQDLVDLNMVRDTKVCGDTADLTVYLTTPACPLKDQIKKDVETALRAGMPELTKINIKMGADVKTTLKVSNVDLLKGVKNVIAVASGKGGVGKSTVSTNLALALAACGATVGLLDADIYGPNIPKMLGKENHKPEWRDEKIQPAENHGIKFFSMAFLVPPDQAVIWRGPMLHSAIQQFLRDIKWGDLDYLIIDLPPGTGDVQLSLSQTIALTGAVVVSTPQQVALSDVRKGIAMFKQVAVPVLGVIENMSTFACPNCKCETDIFLSGGAEQMAKDYNIPFLGKIPLDKAIAVGGDDGMPVTVRDPNGSVAQRFLEIAQGLAARVSITAYQAASN